jgi:hypothetical protein
MVSMRWPKARRDQAVEWRPEYLLAPDAEDLLGRSVEQDDFFAPRPP